MANPGSYQHAASKPEIGREFLRAGPAPRVTASFSLQRDIAKLTARVDGRVVRALPFFHQLLGHFISQFAVDSPPFPPAR